MIELSVCIGSSCHIKGSYNVIQTFQQMIEENNLHGQVDFKGTFCMKQCDKPGVAVAIDNEKYTKAAAIATSKNRCFYINFLRSTQYL